MINYKYAIGDKVDYVNEFGVLFKERVITEIDTTSVDKPMYFINTSAYWISKDEYCLYTPGTYIEPSTDLLLKNDVVAKFSHYDDFCRKVYTLPFNNISLNVVLVDGVLFTISDYGEPLSRLKDEYQIKKDELCA